MASPQTLHDRVYKARGKAHQHACWRCAELGVGRQAHDWAQVHGTDGTDPWADYVPLCRGCHLIYDGNSRKPHQLSPEGLAGQREKNRRRVDVGQCSGCGIDRDSYTTGCTTCINRRCDRRRQPRNRSGR